ncbi:MAG: glycosyltransferase family 2 protein [Cytophagales bacterium]|nr:glycosyltransferase family 2 protein [Cytophagales bacterium]
MNNSISVVIPVYNRRKELIRALESVNAQELQPCEIIVVDDCSPFDVEEFLNANGYSDSTNLYVARNPVNVGPSGSRNIGVAHAQGDFIAFLDSDDYWDKHKLAKQMRLFEQDPNLDLVYNNTWLVYEHKTIRSGKKLFKENLWHQLVNNCWTPPNPSTIMIKREAMKKLGSFDFVLQHAEDIDLWMRLTLQGMKVDYCDEELTYFTFHSTGRLTKQYHKKFTRIKPFFAKWEKHFRQANDMKGFRAFKRGTITKFAIETFADSFKDRSMVTPLKMYFKYLWNKGEFYDMIFRKLLPV